LKKGKVLVLWKSGNKNPNNKKRNKYDLRRRWGPGDKKTRTCWTITIIHNFNQFN